MASFFLMAQTDTGSSERPTIEMESEKDPDVENAGQIPDGGWGWIVCFGGFMINFTAVGMVSSNGILLLAMVDIYEVTISRTAMVGSVFMGIMNGAGPFVLLLMMFHASHRQVIICGGILSAMSTIASFFVNKVEVLYVSYGILTGAFVGISFFSGNTIVGSYFKKKRTIAIGIANSGSGFGAFTLNYLVERSISFYGIRGTFLLISGLFLNFVVFGALCRPLKNFNVSMKNKKVNEIVLKSVKMFQTETNLGFEPDGETRENQIETNTNNSDGCVHLEQSEDSPPTKMTTTLARKCSYLRLAIFNPDVMKNQCMQLLLTIYLFWAAAETVLLYLPAKAVNVGLSIEQGALIMSIYGAMFAFSQFIVGILADFIHVPTSYILMSSMLVMSATAVAFTFVHSFAFFVLCISLFGMCKGFASALRVVLVANILGVKKLEKGFSPLSLLIGVAYIIFPIIAGALFDATQSFDVIFYFASGCLCVGGITSSGIIYMQRKNKFYE